MKRNRYYHGKMLRSEDFISEQQYFLDQIQKRTKLFMGEGIIQGLQIKKSDHECIQITAGSAFDRQGHFIELIHDHEVNIRELDGFSQLNNVHGWLSLRYKEIAEDQEFCEYANDGHHEEYGKWRDSWDIHIQAERENDLLESLYFSESIIYQDGNVQLLLMIPDVLPVEGDVSLMLKVFKHQTGAFTGTLYCQSSHYELQPFLIHMEASCSTKVFHIPMIRNLHKIGSIVEIIVGRLKQQDHYDSIELRYKTMMEEDIKHYMYAKWKVEAQQYNQAIILGHIRFAYQEEQLVITDVDEQGRWELINLQMELLLENYQKRLLLNKPMERMVEGKDEQPLLTNCGAAIIMCDKKQPIYYSEEIVHGLGTVETTVQISFEKMEKDKPLAYQKVLFSGDLSLFQDIQYSVQVYPSKGSFQIAIKLPKRMKEDMLRVHWYAQRWDFPQEERGVQLLRLQPSTITLKIKEQCQFTAVFDGMEDAGSVRFALEDEAAGELLDDGTFTAKEVPGMYQIKAYYRDQQVHAYVKVVKEGE